jgi:hypothetical protein
MANEPEIPESWAIRHFSLSNAVGPDQGDVPALLRRTADTLDRLKAITVQDIVFHSELDISGNDWPAITVYFHYPEKMQES